MRRIAGLLSVVLALVSGALGAVTREAGADTGAPRVTMLSAGKAPLTPLRLVLVPGKSHGLVEFREELHQFLDGSPGTDVNTPPIRIPIDASVDAVSAKGDASVSTMYGDPTVVDDGSSDAESRASLESTLTTLDGVTTTATVTPRNARRDPQVSGTEQLDSTTAQLAEQLGSQLGYFSVLFPQEAVGVGGRWRTTTSLTAAGIDVVQTYDCTLRARQANVVTIDVEYVQTAPRQRVSLPGVPKTARVDLTRYRVTGRGTVTLDLASVLPADGTIHASGVQVFRVRAPGDEATLTQKLAFDVALTPVDVTGAG